MTFNLLLVNETNVMQ